MLSSKELSTCMKMGSGWSINTSTWNHVQSILARLSSDLDTNTLIEGTVLSTNKCSLSLDLDNASKVSLYRLLSCSSSFWGISGSSSAGDPQVKLFGGCYRRTERLWCGVEQQEAVQGQSVSID